MRHNISLIVEAINDDSDVEPEDGTLPKINAFESQNCNDPSVDLHDIDICIDSSEQAQLVDSIFAKEFPGLWNLVNGECANLLPFEDKIGQDEIGLSFEIPEDDDEANRTETDVFAEDASQHLHIAEANDDHFMEPDGGDYSKISVCETQNPNVPSFTPHVVCLDSSKELQVENSISTDGVPCGNPLVNDSDQNEISEDQQPFHESDLYFPSDDENDVVSDNSFLFPTDGDFDMEVSAPNIPLENITPDAAGEIESPIATATGTCPSKQLEPIPVEIETETISITSSSLSLNLVELIGTPTGYKDEIKCSACNAILFCDEVWQKHKQYHLENSDLSWCVICHNTFPSKEELEVHCIEQHTINLSQPEPNTKPEPIKTLTSKQSATSNSNEPASAPEELNKLDDKHTVEILDGQTYYHCSRDQCYYQTPHQHYIQKHLYIHKLEDFMTITWGENKCNLCAHISSSRSKMRKHVRKEHFKELGLAQDTSLSSECLCSICGKGFSSPDKVKSHMEKEHEKKENFSCDVCGRLYNELQSLEDHKARNHPQPKKVKCAKVICEHCGMEFSSKDTLRPHLIFDHDQEPKRGKRRTERIHICEACGAGFASLVGLCGHKRANHPELYKFKCKHCSLMYAHKILLQRHLEKEHQSSLGCGPVVHESKTSVKCPKCDVVVQKNWFRRHMKSFCKGQRP